MRQKFKIEAVWDEEARVWVASSEDVPGLACEAETVELLLGKLRAIVPELLELNNVDTGQEIPIELLTQDVAWRVSQNS